MAKQLNNINFLLDSINLDEFRMQCDMWGIDFVDAVNTLYQFGLSSGLKCIILDHLYWINKDGKEVNAPDTIDGPFSCAHSSITSLKGSPRKVKHDFYCGDSLIKSLEGAPQEVGGNFECSMTYITSLKGAPQKVGGDFRCNCNLELVSLEGGPKAVGGAFECEYTSISSLNGAPSYIGSSLFCRDNTHVSEEQEKEYIRGCHRLYSNGIENWKKAHIDQTGHYRELDSNGKHKEYK